jgi:hypothetical protein
MLVRELAFAIRISGGGARLILVTATSNAETLQRKTPKQISLSYKFSKHHRDQKNSSCARVLPNNNAILKPQSKSSRLASGFKAPSCQAALASSGLLKTSLEPPQSPPPSSTTFSLTAATLHFLMRPR